MPALELDIKTIRHKDKALSFTVQVVKQRYRGSLAYYTASNDFRFTSFGCPEIGYGYNSRSFELHHQAVLYLRGSSRHKDNRILKTNSIGYIEKLKEAVIEYNEHFE